jgi:hypothetical protein
MPAINKCDHCGRPFGMIRHRWWTQQYCRRVCYDIAASQRERIRTFLRKLVEAPEGKPSPPSSGVFHLVQLTQNLGFGIERLGPASA